MRVLVVDDSSAIRRELTLAIGGITGVAEVLEAEDGVVALLLITRHSPHVVVLDISMPTLNGFEVLDSVRKRSPAPQVMVLSAHAEYRQHAIRRGADSFFEKGTEIDALCAAISGLAATHHARPA